MPYVVVAVGPIGNTMWLTAPNVDGRRTFAVRWLADVFDSREVAEALIEQIQRDVDTTGVELSIQYADEWQQESA